MSQSSNNAQSIAQRRRFLRALAGSTGLLALGPGKALAGASLGESLLLLAKPTQDDGGGPDVWCTYTGSFSNSMTSEAGTGTFLITGENTGLTEGTYTESFSRAATDTFTESNTYYRVIDGLIIGPIDETRTYSAEWSESWAMEATLSVDQNGSYSRTWSYINDSEMTGSSSWTHSITVIVPCEGFEPLAVGASHDQTRELIIQSLDAEIDLYAVNSRHKERPNLNF